MHVVGWRGTGDSPVWQQAISHGDSRSQLEGRGSLIELIHFRRVKYYLKKKSPFCSFVFSKIYVLYFHKTTFSLTFLMKPCLPTSHLHSYQRVLPGSGCRIKALSSFSGPSYPIETAEEWTGVDLGPQKTESLRSSQPIPIKARESNPNAHMANLWQTAYLCWSSLPRRRPRL